HRKTYQNIFLVGHSMGGLLALNASLVKQNHVCGVVLLSTPLKLDFRPHSLLRKASLIILPAGHAVKDSYWQAKGFSGFAICPNWIKPFCGFSRLLRKTQPILQHISVPVLAVHSLNDETVSFKSAGMFIESLRNTTIKHMTLEKSWHSYYTPIERELIQSALLEFYNECL
ncbi:MAG: alpha/beta fold hydrolase, partial [Clostridiales bacterium]|nr:alpha/beta fold hydrolase [Clostridiales bacterium]